MNADERAAVEKCPKCGARCDGSECECPFDCYYPSIANDTSSRTPYEGDKP